MFFNNSSSFFYELFSKKNQQKVIVRIIWLQLMVKGVPSWLQMEIVSSFDHTILFYNFQCNSFNYFGSRDCKSKYCSAGTVTDIEKKWLVKHILYFLFFSYTCYFQIPLISPCAQMFQLLAEGVKAALALCNLQFCRISPTVLRGEKLQLPQ